MFKLDPRLAADSLVIGRFPLSLLLMSKDANYPWFILVPEREGVSELYQLNDDDAMQLMAESRRLSAALMDVFGGHKLNVAALGNIVSQLHLHHVVRFKGDSAWPGPVWGAKPLAEFQGEEAAQRVAAVTDILGAEIKSA
jgi:diadenosine tetraphosphate (Ap4A) HIT family hydrolase